MPYALDNIDIRFSATICFFLSNFNPLPFVLGSLDQVHPTMHQNLSKNKHFFWRINLPVQGVAGLLSKI